MTTPWTMPPAPDAWQHLPFFDGPCAAVAERVARSQGQVLPQPEQTFAALEACAPADVRVVILGQDPYPTPGHAHGLAFSVAPDVQPFPRSLANIFKEMHADLGDAPTTGDLRFWAEQGVLLLNTALSVQAGAAGSHARFGWSALTHDVLTALNDRPRAALLWGRHAQQAATPLNNPKHLLCSSAHPSPLSARRGFFGSRPFSRVNEWLKANGQTPINWTKP